jgi:hypothetical protein
VLHVVALIAAIALWRLGLAPFAAAVVLTALLGRAVYGFTHAIPPAKTIGWREIAFGALFVVITAYLW